MPDTSRPGLAALWMLGSIAAFTAMAIAGRALTGQHDTFEIMLWRSVVGLGLVLGVGSATGSWRQITARHLPNHIVRNLVHFTGQNLWFWALTLIPLAQLFALEFTSPIWVMALSPLLLGDRLRQRHLLSAVVGLAGVWMVARPDFTAIDPGVLAAAASAISFALSAIMTKRLTRIEGVISILFWLALMQAVLGLTCALADGAMRLPTLASAPWLAVVGASGIFAHLCLTKALSLAPAAVVMPIDFARLPVIALVGWAAYGEAIGAALAAGAGLILLANWINLRP